MSDYVQALFVTASAHTWVNEFVVPSPALICEVIADTERGQTAATSTPAVREALEEICRLTGLPRSSIASDILGVSRRAFYDWAEGKGIAVENEKRLFETLDVLRRAAARRPTPDLMRAWLFTPVGSRAERPADSLKEGATDRARLLAVSSLPKREKPLPDWLLSAPINEWSDRELRGLDLVARETTPRWDEDDEAP